MIGTYGIIAVLLILAELAYFRIADRCNIIDKPNERSSHSTIVLRGGGIIFAISMIVWMILQMVNGEWGMVNDYLLFIVGLVLICGVSFWDDVKSLPDSVRLVAQFMAVALMAWCIVQAYHYRCTDCECGGNEYHQFHGWHQWHNGRVCSCSADTTADIRW